MGPRPRAFLSVPQASRIFLTLSTIATKPRRAQLPMSLPIELADALAAASGVSESSHGARYDPAKLSRFTELLATHAAKPVRPSPHSAQA